LKTERLEVVAGQAGADAIERAADLLREGRLVAFPTETVYGLGALALDPAAVERIFEAKGRPAFNPLIAHVLDAEQARSLVRRWPPQAEALAAAFWPGPLTLVLPKDPKVPDQVTAGLPSVAVRAPAHPVARDLLRAVGAPIAAPSANRYMAVSPTAAPHVEKGLGGRIDAILDGGATPLGIESTVLDLTGSAPVLLRPGAITIEELSAVVGPIERPGASPAEGAARASPGMAHRHYAPDAKLELLPQEEIASRIAAAPPAERIGVVARSPRPAHVQVEAWLQLPSTPRGYATQLYAALHALEDAAVVTILVESVPDGADWEGPRDRLSRAGGLRER